MSFDLKRFNSTKLAIRTKEVDVPALKPFFDEDEKPVFVVKGISGEELARVNEQVYINAGAQKAIELAQQKGAQAGVEAVRTLLGGFSDNVPDTHVRNINIVHLGCVEPKLERPDVVRLAQNYPIEFSILSQEILKLTGQGATIDQVKSTASGKTEASE